jgi:hypothetical protein
MAQQLPSIIALTLGVANAAPAAQDVVKSVDKPIMMLVLAGVLYLLSEAGYSLVSWALVAPLIAAYISGAATDIYFS